MAIVLVLTILVPLAIGAGLLLMPSSQPGGGRAAALVGTLLSLTLALTLAATFPAGTEGYQHVLRVPWLTLGQGAQIQFAFGLDGVSLWLFTLAPLLTLTAVLASWEVVTERSSAYYGLMLMLCAGMMGVFASLDVVLFYVFFEFTLIPGFFLIGLWGGPQRREAAVTFVLYTLAGSLLTLVGVVALVAIAHQYGEGRPLTFSIPELTAILSNLNWSAWNRSGGSLLQPTPQALVFLLLLAGFAVKTPIVPFHGWLPAAYTQAPTPVTILLSGGLSKLGAYGLIRFNLGMTPLGLVDFAEPLAVLAVVGILYGALVALAQPNLKSMVAYSSLSHMGFIVLGLVALNPTALDGAVVQMVNHGISSAALFLGVALIQRRYQTADMDLVQGVWSKIPALAVFVIIAALGSAGLPGLNGFVGEFPILAGAFEYRAAIGVFAALGMILGAWYLIGMVRNVMFGPASPRVVERSRSLSPVELAAFLPVTALTVLLGIAPALVLDKMSPALVPTAQRIEHARLVARAAQTPPPVEPQPPATTKPQPDPAADPSVAILRDPHPQP